MSQACWREAHDACGACGVRAEPLTVVPTAPPDVFPRDLPASRSIEVFIMAFVGLLLGAALGGAIGAILGASFFDHTLAAIPFAGLGAILMTPIFAFLGIRIERQRLARLSRERPSRL